MKKFLLCIAVLCISTQSFAQNQIIQYEYWFNSDYASAVTVAVSPTDTLDLNTNINVGNLPVGLNKFHIRFQDNKGVWSSPVGQYIIKNANNTVQTQIVAYEYWFDNDYAPAVRKTINPTDTFDLVDNIKIDNLSHGSEGFFRIRFLDDKGNWSVPQSSYFGVKAIADFTHIVGLSEVTFTNTSSYADTFRWNFADGTTTTQVNPLHTYTEPGAYRVQLIASNFKFSDTVYHYVEIDGIKTFSPNKAGNGGFASINIYGGKVNDSIQVTLVKGSETITTYSVYKKEIGVVCATFDLTDKNTGIYDVVIISNTKTYTFENGFTIEETRQPEAYAELQGNAVFQVGRWQTYTVHYGNLGNIDIYGLPINLIFSDIADVEFLFDLIDTIGGASTNINDPENYVELDSLYGEAFKGKMYSILIPHIPASTNSSLSFRLKVNTANSIKVYATTGQILNNEYLNTQEAEIESDEIFGYELTDSFKIKKEDISQLIRNEINKSFQNPQTPERKQFVNFIKLLETNDGFTKLQKAVGGTVANIKYTNNPYLNFYTKCTSTDKNEYAQWYANGNNIHPCRSEGFLSKAFDVWHIFVENKSCKEMYLQYYYISTTTGNPIYISVRVYPGDSKNHNTNCKISESVFILGWAKNPRGAVMN